MTEMTSQKQRNRNAVIEVRFNSLQMIAIERALGKAEGCYLLFQDWYQLHLRYSAQLSRGRSVLVSFPALLGEREKLHGQLPDCRAEWLPMMIKALRQQVGTRLLAEVLTGLYEAIAWGFAEELYAFDGIFDVATLAGRQRLLARRMVMKHLPPAAPAESLSPEVSFESMRQADELSVETVQEAEAKHAPRGGDFFFASPMPHVAGTFFYFDEWTDALMNALGDCLDISESLVEEGTYTVYSHDFESEDTYHTETTSEGFIVN